MMELTFFCGFSYRLGTFCYNGKL